MWILDCKANIFQGKRLWLRPGTRNVFGRVPDRDDPKQYIVNDKTISRKHLMIDVSNVEPGDGANTNTRPEVTIEDLGTKIGTLLDGASIKGQRIVLQGDKHEITLGRHPDLLRITWQPVVLTLSFTSKELRANAAKAIAERLEPLGIKFLNDYVRQHTTHVSTKKRNTSKGLQALVNGKYIVQQDSFLDAILTATELGQEPDGKSHLETDFDSFWPNELDYLPPQGTEPTQLPATAYSPDSTRQNIFEGYSFVFCEEGQYNQLLAPITDGGGKPYLKKAQPDITTVDDFVVEFVQHVKEIAGEKGLGEFEDGSEGKGVVVVRYQASKGSSIQWYADFITQTSQLLDHRPIEQSEFLDAILRNDASVLRRPLEPALSGMPSSSIADSSTSQQIPVVNTPQEASTKTARPKRIFTSRFKGFDDIDISEEPEATPVQTTQVVETHDFNNQESQESSMFVSQGDGPPLESRPTLNEAPSKNTLSRKRSAPPIDEVSVMDQLAPASLGFKRRRLAEQTARRERGESSPLPAPIDKSRPESAGTRNKKPEKQIDVLEVARQWREKEAVLAEADRVALQESLEDMDINEVRSLITIEDMELHSVAPVSRPLHPDDSERWNEQWNGRKNFKKFRRRGQDLADRLTRQVIVELEEVKKKDHGIGDEYWLESGIEDQQRKEDKGKGKSKQSHSQSQLAPTRKLPTKKDDWDDDDMDMSDAPPSVSFAKRTQDSQKLADKTNTARTSQVQNKRPAAALLHNPTPAKKARPTLLEEDSDESDDGTKFKFRKRGR